MKEELWTLRRRIERLERLLLAIGRGIHNDVTLEKGIEYYMIGEDPDECATANEVDSLLNCIQIEVELTTGRMGALKHGE